MNWENVRTYPADSALQATSILLFRFRFIPLKNVSVVSIRAADAGGISEVTGVPRCTTPEVTSSTSTQTRKSRYDRWKNVEGTFVVEDRLSVSGKHVLLIDDVITTGSTMESCVNELLKSEGVRVSVAALAVSLV